MTCTLSGEINQELLSEDFSIRKYCFTLLDLKLIEKFSLSIEHKSIMQIFRMFGLLERDLELFSANLNRLSSSATKPKRGNVHHLILHRHNKNNLKLSELRSCLRFHWTSSFQSSKLNLFQFWRKKRCKIFIQCEKSHLFDFLLIEWFQSGHILISE